MKILGKIKINYAKGKLRQILLFDLPILQYEKSKAGKLKNVKILLFNKPKINKPVFYLKFNSDNVNYSLFCLQHWINIALRYGADYYIVCDKPKLVRKILTRIPFEDSNIKIIGSDYSINKKIIKKICDNVWKKAGYAHLTTFYHAYKNGIKEFWNIDADDTAYMECPNVVANCLIKIAQYAKENDIQVISQDMHRTKLKGLHWSFGVTYVQNYEKIMNILENIPSDWRNGYLSMIEKIYSSFNTDWFFTYLKDNKTMNIETFNIENLYFIHYGCATDYISLGYTLQIARDNCLLYPIKQCYCDKISTPKYKDIKTFNFGISEECSRKFLNQICCWYDNVLNNLINNV